jgi:hypothetical protein
MTDVTPEMLPPQGSGRQYWAKDDGSIVCWPRLGQCYWAAIVSPTANLPAYTDPLRNATAAIDQAFRDAGKHTPEGKHGAVVHTPVGFLLAYCSHHDEPMPDEIPSDVLTATSDIELWRRHLTSE